MKLSNYYDKEDNYYEILPYALKMMECKQIAYEDYFTAYLKIAFNNNYDIKNIQKLSKEEQVSLLNVLFLGMKNDSYACKEILVEYYKEGIVLERDIIKSDSIRMSL